MRLTVYGIPNCSSVKKARAWLSAHGQPFVFHDFKKEGLTRDMVQAWLAHHPWEMLVNRKGTTWRGLAQARKDAILDAGSALELMLEWPSVVKRPILQGPSQCQVGFSDTQYRQIFNL